MAPSSQNHLHRELRHILGQMYISVQTQLSEASFCSFVSPLEEAGRMGMSQAVQTRCCEMENFRFVLRRNAFPANRIFP